ncbi:putative coiled-coil domain-containing protein 22 [Blattamonas nauphoetae]|uniref:Coiled-coil domain-containing protein 22 n=1 Tax=Blattamonas nauphoetae TaxID=2049346 RepID=A0ABQ9X3G8_9EUKA|nr:putative coiled-coil domain-containing protein 22 [Blattamonas nauphoetae]
MEDADLILLYSFKQLGCPIDDSVISCETLPSDTLMTCCATAVNIIDPHQQVPLMAPQEEPSRYRYVQDLKSALHAIGYSTELEYHLLLYPNPVDSRKLLTFLAQQLPTRDQRTTFTIKGESEWLGDIRFYSYQASITPWVLPVFQHTDVMNSSSRPIFPAPKRHGPAWCRLYWRNLSPPEESPAPLVQSLVRGVVGRMLVTYEFQLLSDRADPLDYPLIPSIPDSPIPSTSFFTRQVRFASEKEYSRNPYKNHPCGTPLHYNPHRAVSQQVQEYTIPLSQGPTNEDFSGLHKSITQTNKLINESILHFASLRQLSQKLSRLSDDLMHEFRIHANVTNHAQNVDESLEQLEASVEKLRNRIFSFEETLDESRGAAMYQRGSVLAFPRVDTGKTRAQNLAIMQTELAETIKKNEKSFYNLSVAIALHRNVEHHMRTVAPDPVRLDPADKGKPDDDDDDYLKLKTKRHRKDYVKRIGDMHRRLSSQEEDYDRMRHEIHDLYSEIRLCEERLNRMLNEASIMLAQRKNPELVFDRPQPRSPQQSMMADQKAFSGRVSRLLSVIHQNYSSVNSVRNTLDQLETESMDLNDKILAEIRYRTNEAEASVEAEIKRVQTENDELEIRTMIAAKGPAQKKDTRK